MHARGSDPKKKERGEEMLQTQTGVREAPMTLPGKNENDPTRPRVDLPISEGGMDEPGLDVDNIQGNILAGFNKDHQTHLYLRINEPRDAATVEAFRRWLGRLIPFIATTNEVLRFNRLFKEIRRRRCQDSRTVMATWINVALSFEALKLLAGDGEALKERARTLPGFKGAAAGPLSPEAFVDEAFKQGMPGRAVGILSDPANETMEGNPGNWVFGREGEEPDVVVIVASDSASELAAEVGRIEDGIYGGRPGHGQFGNSGVTIVYKQHGNTLPQPLTGHEHFGFLDGVSQPGVRGIVSKQPFDLLTPRQNPEEGQHLHQGKPGQDLLWPGEFVFGYPGQDPAATGGEGPDEGIHKQGPNSLGDPGSGWKAPVWAKDGAFLVVRRLRQEVGRFHEFLRQKGTELGLGDDRLGAMLVGRWKGGAPILRADHDDSALGNDDCANNHFEFVGESEAIPKQTPAPGCADESGLCSDEREPRSLGDKEGLKCPFGGHIRKAYPRDDEGQPAQPDGSKFETVSEVTTQTHRLLRRGIPFGDPFYPAPGEDVDTGNRGLLFACYQTSIQEQFEFVTQSWVNNPQFKDKDDGETRKSGHDLILGQSNHGGSRARHCVIHVDGEPRVLEARPEDEWVIPTGGGYFFAPSIDALCLLTGTPGRAAGAS
jgi:Dyp-type peroxidase family